jgi:glycosyltransferase involved in cell wall biosynthesis
MSSRRKVLFYRDFKRFTGGHLQVWHYFQHMQSSDRYQVEVVFSPDSLWDVSNPWYVPGTAMPTASDGIKPDLLFLGGLDWEGAQPLLQADPDMPVINLLQGFAHAKPDNARSQSLDRPALRICVSEQVREAIVATGKVNGPVYVVPNGMDRSELPPRLPDGDKDIDVLIAAVKHPGMGPRLGRALQPMGLRIQLLDKHMPRNDYYAAIRRARISVFFPQREEGFFFPPLEGMALGTLVVCPDCVGNRGHCLPGVNCLRPAYDYDAVLHAVQTALKMDASERAAFRTAGDAMVATHDLMAERGAYLKILTDTGFG